MEKADFLVVGAGFSGATIAERLASKGFKVIVIDKRDHIGGNSYDFYNNNILCPLYGPHMFHTSSQEVWDYLSRFTDWTPYKHKVLSNVDGNLKVPVPVNITTVNLLFNQDIKSEEEMEEWLKKEVEPIAHPKNSEEVSISRVGRRLYEKLFKNYTKKQWDLWPNELAPEIMSRIPIRKNFDDGYFLDAYQAMPKEGYTKLIQNMLYHPNIKVLLSTDFFKMHEIEYHNLIFTGRIDEFFKDSGLDRLQYRALSFEIEPIEKEYFQEVAVVNYPNTEKFIRITEPKHSTGQKAPNTVIVKEFPNWTGEPCYPVLNDDNKKLYSEYEKLAKEAEKNKVFFLGRLGEYKYLDMDKTVLNALNFSKRFEK